MLALFIAGWLAVIVPGAMFVAKSVRRRRDGVGPMARRSLMRYAAALLILAFFTVRADALGELVWLATALAVAGLGVGIWARVLPSAAAGSAGDFTMARPWVPAVGLVIAFAAAMKPMFAGVSPSKVAITQMKSDLRTLAWAEDDYRKANGHYTAALDSLRFTPDPAVNAPQVTAGKDWYIATIAHRRYRGVTCRIAVGGSGSPTDDTTATREPVCS